LKVGCEKKRKEKKKERIKVFQKFFWRGYGCQAIGDPTILGLHWEPLLLVLI
jgi:hypothetical protein